MGRIQLPIDDGEGLVEELWEGKFRVMFVSDGSVRAGRAAHLWVIEGWNRRHRVDGAGPCDGNPRTVDSYRAEFLGLLAMLYFL